MNIDLEETALVRVSGEEPVDLSDLRLTPDPESIEARRVARAENYDSSTLDMYLTKQSEPRLY